MNRLNILLSIITMTAGLQACSIFYFGYSKDEWKNLSEEERLAAKTAYQPAIDSRKDQEHSDKIDARTQSVIDYGAGKIGSNPK